MKIKTLTSCFLLALAMSSCIQDEALNSEAAIDACTGADVQLANINADEKKIDVYVHRGADLAKQQLSFTLPEGASIKPNEYREGDIGTFYNFSEAGHSRSFTVTSEDGKWKPVYEITINPTELPTFYHFEELLVAANTPYHTFYEFQPSSSQSVSKVLQWSSGNPGFKLTGMSNSPEDYPTVQVSGGYEGKCARLETKDTGSFGAMVKMYIAAGNLFIGDFDLANALSNAPKATTFGFQFYERPKTLKGYYKFKAGEVYTENGEAQSGKKDRFDIYAIMYEAESNSDMLDGTNALSSDKVVLRARISEVEALEADQWTVFELPFEPRNGKTIDETKLQTGKYKLGIVFASSVDGAYFKGAVGSTLYIDEVELICEEN